MAHTRILIHCCWLLFALDGKASTNTDEMSCRRQLQLIHDATMAFEEAFGRLPGWSEELLPSYISRAEIFVCPVARKQGASSLGALNVTDHSNSWSTYPYQFMDKRLTFRGRDRKRHESTHREFKELQEEVVGSRVPLFRCFWHGPDQVLNLARSGQIYVSGTYWESEFVDTLPLPYLGNGLLLEGRAPIRERVPPRKGHDFERSVNLGTNYNALLTDPWLTGSYGRTLEPLLSDRVDYAGSVFDVRGILQLNGGGFGARAYPTEINGIRVERECHGLVFLHACAFGTSPGVNVGRYVIHFSDETPSQTVELEFGRNIAGFVQRETERHPALTEATRLWESPSTTPGGERYQIAIFAWEFDSARRVSSIDFQSSESRAAPFVLGINLLTE